MSERAGLAFRRTAGRWEAGVKRTLASAVRAGRRSLNARDVRRAGNNTGRLTMALLPYGAAYQRALLPLEDTIQSAYLAGWRLAMWELSAVTALAQGDDPMLAAVIAWAEAYAADLIVDITEETRQGIRLLVAQAFRTGIPPGPLSRLILAQTALGLDGRRMSALLMFRFRTVNAQPGQVVQAGSREHRIPKTGVTAELVEKWTEAYGTRLLIGRASTIARTATIRAAAAGQLAAWEAAITTGLLRGTEKRRWSAAPGPKTCLICQYLNGQERAFGEPFETADGRLLLYPGAHPACRCSVVLAI